MLSSSGSSSFVWLVDHEDEDVHSKRLDLLAQRQLRLRRLLNLLVYRSVMTRFAASSAC